MKVSEKIKTWEGVNKYLVKKYKNLENKVEVEEVIPEAPLEDEPIAELNAEDLFRLNKKEQVKMLKDLGVEEIPKLEKDRVDLILELK